MQAWFKFKGIDSRSMGVIVTAMPPTVRPDKRVTAVTIAGKNGTLHMDEGVYDSYIRTMECAISKRKKIDEIAAWLCGSGEIIFSTEPDKVYKVMIANKVEIAQMMRHFQKFMVTMDTQPFKYSTNAIISHADDLVLTAPTTLNNRGTVYSQPTITVYGTGNITLTINGTAYGLTSVDSYITIDSEMMEVYKGTANANNKYSAMDFPRFEVGINTISWTGTVSKVEINPKWRWL